MSHKKNYESSAEIREAQYQELLSAIYASGCRIEDYSKVLLYLQSFLLAQNKEKKEVLDNWTVPYIESLLIFFSELKKDKEIMDANRNYIKF